MAVGPLEGTHHESLLAFFRHGNDHDPPTRSQDPFTLSQHPWQFRRVEQFQGEAHEDPVHRLCLVGEFFGVPACEIHLASQVLPFEQLSCVGEHVLGEVNTEDLS